MGAALQRPTYEKKRIFNVKREKTGWAWLKNYSKFVDSDEFDKHMEMILAEKKKYFPKTQLCILKVLRGFAVKYGVVNLTHREIIKEVQKQYGHKVCAKTITNLTQKLEAMGIVIVFPGQRSDLRYTGNVVVFNRYEDMRAYEIAQLKEKEEEIERLMMQDLANASGALNYAAKARQWAEEKARKEADAEAAKKAAEENQKRETLYKKLMAYVAAKKINKSQAGQLAAILYKRINEAMAADNRLSQEQAELIAWDAFMSAISSKYKNLFALVSFKTKDMFDKFAISYKPSEFANKRSNTAQGRTEQVPDWFDERNANTNRTEPNNTIDFEAERRKMLKKLGQE